MAEDQIEHESRGRHKGTLWELLGIFLGISMSYLMGFLMEGKASSKYRGLGALVIAASFGAVIIQALLAIYLGRRRLPGRKLKRRIQEAYSAALESSSLNPSGKGER